MKKNQEAITAIQNYTTEIKEEIIKIRRYIHENPELSFEEYNTTTLIYNQLQDTNITLQKCSGGTGLIGVLEGNGEGPTLGIRGDMDALPIIEETELGYSSQKEGVMHACGHDIHTSVLLGTAIVLDKINTMFKGTIKFIFQPAEEIMQGAKFMIDQGVLNNPEIDNIVCLHTWPFTDAGKIGVRHGPIMASTNHFEIEVFGTGGHAAHPHKSVDPVPVAAQIVTSLQQIVSRSVPPMDPAVVTVGQIHGGKANNVIASGVTISGTVRTLKRETSDKVEEMMNDISKKVAEAFHASAEVKYSPGASPVINNESMVNILDNSVKEILGEESLEYLPEPSLGGEDFSFYLNYIDGMLFRLGTGNQTESSRRGLHNPGIIFDECAIETGIQAMSSFAVNYLNK